MNFARPKLLISIILLMGISLAIAGCSSQKAAKPMPGTPTEVADLVETETDKVEGVSRATALVADKTIYIGLQLQEDYTKQAADIEQSVLDRMTYLEPDYNIGVTSDTEIVGEIKEVAAGFAQGSPLSSFSNEIKQIDQGIKLKNEALDKEKDPTAIK